MIGQSPTTAADIDIVGDLAPTLTPSRTKLFRRLCDWAQSHILRTKWQQKAYADIKRRDAEFHVGNKVWINSRNLPSSPMATGSGPSRTPNGHIRS